MAQENSLHFSLFLLSLALFARPLSTSLANIKRKKKKKRGPRAVFYPTDCSISRGFPSFLPFHLICLRARLASFRFVALGSVSTDQRATAASPPAEAIPATIAASRRIFFFSPRRAPDRPRRNKNGLRGYAWLPCARPVSLLLAIFAPVHSPARSLALLSPVTRGEISPRVSLPFARAYTHAHARTRGPSRGVTIFPVAWKAGRGTRDTGLAPPRASRVINGGFSPTSSLSADFTRGQLIESLILCLFPDDSVGSNINEDGFVFPVARDFTFELMNRTAARYRAI